MRIQRSFTLLRDIQILSVLKPKVEPRDSNLYMVQQKMCGICGINVASHITSLLWRCSYGALCHEYEPSSWVERVCNTLFPLWFQRGYNMSLNLCTIDRSGALQDWERWLLEQIPIHKKMGGSEKWEKCSKLWDYRRKVSEIWLSENNCSI